MIRLRLHRIGQCQFVSVCEKSSALRKFCIVHWNQKTSFSLCGNDIDLHFHDNGLPQSRRAFSQFLNGGNLVCSSHFTLVCVANRFDCLAVWQWKFFRVKVAAITIKLQIKCTPLLAVHSTLRHSQSQRSNRSFSCFSHSIRSQFRFNSIYENSHVPLCCSKTFSNSISTFGVAICLWWQFSWYEIFSDAHFRRSWHSGCWDWNWATVVELLFK